MDKLKLIIEQIKILFNKKDLTEEKIFDLISTEFKIEIEKNGLSKKDVLFLIELCINNILLSDDILKDIFLNSRNKVEQKILVSTAGNTTSELIDNVEYDNLTINMFTRNGSIYIHPKKLILLWNNKNGNRIVQSKTNNDEDLDIKSINYFIFLDREETLNDNSLITQITDHYLRNFGIEDPKGFKGRYQIHISLDNDDTYTSLETLYKGECDLYIDEKYFSFNLENSIDIYKTVGKASNALVSIFSKQNSKILYLLKLFFSNYFLFPYIDIIFKSLNKEKTIIKKKKYNKFQPIEEKSTNNLLNQFFMTEPCDHIEEYQKVYKLGNYYENVNKFIKNFINYMDGRAICVLCNEAIRELNIQASFFIDKEKFITTPDNILLYAPYNKFNNLKFFMDNLFYVFMFNTKIGIYNSTTVIRILIDNLILVSSNRIDLEIKYKKDIINENIFLLRLTNNFFESQDLEKEKYKEKRAMYTNLPAYIIIFITAPLSDYYDYFFLKKRLKLDKINLNWNDITFEDVIAAIIDSIFKNIIENYIVEHEKQRIIRLKRSIQIYYEIFNEEFKLLYEEKKVVFEAYLKRLAQRTHVYIIPTIGNYMDGRFATEFNSLGQYLLYVNKVDMLRNEKVLKYYQSLNLKIEDINKNVNIESIRVKNFNVTQTEFDKKSRLMNLNLFDIYEQDSTKKDIDDLDEVCFEFTKEKYYSYNNEKYTILPVENFYILDSEKQKIEFEDTDLLNIETLNTYRNKELIIGDIFLYVQDLKSFHIEYILRHFFIYLSKKYNIIINSNINKFSKILFKSRRELFLIKIKILNLVTKLKN